MQKIGFYLNIKFKIIFSTWDIYALVGSELKKRDKEGVDYELYDAVGQQNQLQEEHQKMVKIFEKDANFKKMIDSKKN